MGYLSLTKPVLALSFIDGTTNASESTKILADSKNTSYPNMVTIYKPGIISVIQQWDVIM